MLEMKQLHCRLSLLAPCAVRHSPTDKGMVSLQVPISCLQWEHRGPLILQEIREADADIICLQELNHFGKQAAQLGAGIPHDSSRPMPTARHHTAAGQVACQGGCCMPLGIYHRQSIAYWLLVSVHICCPCAAGLCCCCVLVCRRVGSCAGARGLLVFLQG